MTFTYNFDTVNDRTQFAYCIPYTYSQVLSLIRQITPNSILKYETGWRTLSGLPVPILQITDFQQPSHNKKIVLVTARVHPGQSNSSFVCQGLVRSLLSESDGKIRQFLKNFHFYIIPMLNPDGVIAGNYRTSLFGKDLNRTFNQSRKFAFPETFHLLQFAKNLKKQHKQRFMIYLDLHGHSVKKNIFFYGPDYSISHPFYMKCREFGKILGNLTCMFRFYSCIFHISNEKTTTARATFNREVNIPFTYTVQSSNGAFYDSIQHNQKSFTAKHWFDMGGMLVRGLHIWSQNDSLSIARMSKSSYRTEYSNKVEGQDKQLLQNQPPGKQKVSDDEINQGKSDSEPQNQDFTTDQLSQLLKQIEGKVDSVDVQSVSSQKQIKRQFSPEKIGRVRDTKMRFDWSNNLRQSYNSYSRKQSLKMQRRQKLPPLNLQVNPIQFLNSGTDKKRVTIVQALKNLTSGQYVSPSHGKRNKRLAVSQMMVNERESFINEEKDLLLDKKFSKQQRLARILKKN